MGIGHLNTTGCFWLAAGTVLLVRVVSLWFNNADLFYDEAQYWAWSKDPAFGYFSKPPLLAWLIGGVTALFGDSEFCIRLISPIVHTATGFLLFLTAGRLLDNQTGFWTGIIYLTLPAVSLSSTLVSTDVPLLLFWSLALYAFIRLENDGGWRWAVLLGVALGGGLLAKYAMAYFLLCAVVYSVAAPERPHMLRRGRFWMAIAIACLILAPNIWWNMTHHFPTGWHTWQNMGWGNGFPRPSRTAEFLGSQFGAFGPILFIIYLLAVFRLIRRDMDRVQKLLVSFSLPIFVLITMQALINKAYANWAATAYPAAVILVADLLVNRMSPYWNRISYGLHAMVFAVIAIGVCYSKPGQLPLLDEHNPFRRMWGGKELGRVLTEDLAAGGYTNILADTRRKSATLIYYLRSRPEKVVAWRGSARARDHFELTRALQDMPEDELGRSVFLYPTTDLKPNRAIARHFSDIESVRTVEGLPGSTKALGLYRLQGYRP